MTLNDRKEIRDIVEFLLVQLKKEKVINRNQFEMMLDRTESHRKVYGTFDFFKQVMDNYKY